MVTKNCVECKKEFISKPSSNRKFCSQKCYFKMFGNRQLGKNNPFYKTGLGNSRFYNIWRGIVKRCTNVRHKSYKRYGGRGIVVLWKSFIEFKNDMYRDYLKHKKEFGDQGTTIDRIDNNGNYCKENCKWSTWKEQANNRDNNYTINNLGKFYVKKSIA